MKVKDRPNTLIRRVALTLLLVPGVLAIPACAKSSRDDRSVRIPEAPVDDAASVTVSDGGTTTLDLGGGAHLIIPPGAMTPGATVSASYGDPPEGDWGAITPLSHPVELVSDPADAIHGLLTLEFPASGDLDTSAFGVSTFDETTGTWTPVTATLDTARNMIVAQIAHFSWWNPFSWDWTGLGASVNQRVGELVGKRAPAARCSRGQATPEWVSMVNGVSNDAAIAVRGCAEGENGLVVVELQNNRPYGMFLHYGAPVKFGWHERGDSALDVVRNKFADMVTIPDQLYIPPLGRASVGIYQFSGFREFRAGADWRSISIDVLANLLGETLGMIPQAGACLSGFMGHPLGEFSVGKVRDGVKEMLGCVTREAASMGYFDSATIQQLDAIEPVAETGPASSGRRV